MNAIFYSLAYVGMEAPLVQLARSIESIRNRDTNFPIFVYVFGEPPPRFIQVLRQLRAEVRSLGDHRTYIARTQGERAELFAMDPKIHRWLVLQESDLKACGRLLYVDSDTFFFSSPTRLFERYGDADLYAREEPLSRRSIHGYNPSYVDEEGIAELGRREGIVPVPPFNTGVCLFTRDMADAISTIVPKYFDYVFRFMAWFHRNPDLNAPAPNPADEAVFDRFLRGAAEQALPYPSQNRWIVDQVALWLALGDFPNLRLADFVPSDVWQGGEFQHLSRGGPFPILCHYFGSNTARFFERVKALSSHAR